MHTLIRGDEDLCDAALLFSTFLYPLQQQFQEKEIRERNCVNIGERGVWMSGSDKLVEIFHSTVRNRHYGSSWCHRSNDLLQMGAETMEDTPESYKQKPDVTNVPPVTGTTPLNRWVTIRPHWQEHDIILSVDKAAWVKQKIECVGLFDLFQKISASFKSWL